MGFIIGVGILRTPGEIAQIISDPTIYLALWVFGGVFTLLSVLIVGELMAETPKSGGIYPLIAHAWGPYPGFLVGWVGVAAGPASVALKTVVLVEYLALLIPSMSEWSTPLALLITTVFAALQLGGLRLGANLHQAAVACLGVMFIGLIAVLFLGDSDTGETASTELGATASEMGGWGIVVASIVFAYNGWIAPSAFGSEYTGGGRAIALGAIRGTIIVSLIFVLLNLALVTSVPLESLTNQDLAIAEAIRILYGTGTPIILLAIFVLLIHQNFDYMRGPRTLYALSVDGLGTKRATNVTDNGTPLGAVAVQWGLVVVFILAGGFRFLLTMTSMLMLISNFLAVLGVFRLRRREPDAVRPYRAWGFPATGYLVSLGFVFLLLVVGVSEPTSALFAVGVVLVSIPAYIWRSSATKAALATQTE